MAEPDEDRASDEPAAPAALARNATRTRRSWDAYAAIVATLIGFLALVVSGYTAHVQRQQLRAQVWPYLGISSGNVAPYVGLRVSNSGTGPARVIAVRVTVDRHAVKDWPAAQTALGGKPGGIVQSQLGNTVLPSGKELTIVRPYSDDTSAAFIAEFLGDKHDLTVSACYCSVLDDCWLVTTDTPPQPIDGPDACPLPAAERFRQ